MKTIPLLLAFVLLTASASAQMPDTIRVCTWNLLNFTANADSVRHAAMQTVIGAIGPDVLVTQEVEGTFAAAFFWTRVLSRVNPHYSAASMSDGPGSDNGLYFDSTKIEILSTIRRATGQREINGWRLRVRSTGDTIHVYSAHLKEGETTDDIAQRAAEAVVLRRHLDSLPQGSRHIVAGTLNTYSSTEEAYQALTLVGIRAAGEVFDPVNRPGSWHGNEEFVDIHTASTRMRAFGGGAAGGMNDRFDHLLVSGGLLPQLISGSHVTFGNDGYHFNDSINARPNLVVNDIIAKALHAASDHLPVYLDLIFGDIPSGVESEPLWRSKEMDLVERR